MALATATAIVAATFLSKLLFWSLLILLYSNQTAINSSSITSSWLNYDNRNFDFESESRNKKEPSTNITQERLRGSNDQSGLKHIEQEASNNSQRHRYNIVQQFIAGQSLKSTKRCIRHSEKYLYRLLERSGMLNQWFMANNPEQAGRNFVRSHKFFFQTKIDYFDSPQDDGLPPDIQNIDIAFICNDLCQSIIWKLNEALAKEKNDTLFLNAPYLDDSHSGTINNNSTESALTSCQLGMFIPIAKCIQQGTEGFEDHNKLCTSCQGIYMLDKKCFPRFINAIKCENQMQASACIFDKITLRAHGLCYMRTLTFKVLRNVGSEECQEWRYEYIQVPTSCECQLDVESLLLSAVKP